MLAAGEKNCSFSGAIGASGSDGLWRDVVDGADESTGNDTGVAGADDDAVPVVAVVVALAAAAALASA